jgi:hypothetical protein
VGVPIVGTDHCDNPIFGKIFPLWQLIGKWVTGFLPGKGLIPTRPKQHDMRHTVGVTKIELQQFEFALQRTVA